MRPDTLRSFLTGFTRGLLGGASLVLLLTGCGSPTGSRALTARAVTPAIMYWDALRGVLVDEAALGTEVVVKANGEAIRGDIALAADGTLVFHASRTMLSLDATWPYLDAYVHVGRFTLTKPGRPHYLDALAVTLDPGVSLDLRQPAAELTWRYPPQVRVQSTMLTGNRFARPVSMPVWLSGSNAHNLE